MSSKREKKTSNESETRESKPSDQEFPPKTRIYKQVKHIQKGKVTKSHKTIQ